MDGSAVGSCDGIPLSIARAGVAGNAGYGLSAFAEDHHVYGCLWHLHACPRCRVPSSNRRYWLGKLRRNAERDKQARRKLRHEGWQILTIWKCQTTAKKLNRSAAESRNSWPSNGSDCLFARCLLLPVIVSNEAQRVRLTCEHCGGVVRERRVDREALRHRGSFVILEDVPVGVCEKCGRDISMPRSSAASPKSVVDGATRFGQWKFPLIDTLPPDVPQLCPCSPAKWD